MNVMEVSNVCFVIMKDGKTLNKWEVYTAKPNQLNGRRSYTFYYLDTKEDAETLRLYLMHKECERISKGQLTRKYSYNKEREEWSQLLESLDVASLEEAYNKLTPLIIHKEEKCLN